MADTNVDRDLTLRAMMVDYVEPGMMPLIPTGSPMLNDFRKSVAPEMFVPKGGGAFKVYEAVKERLPQGAKTHSTAGGTISDYADATPTKGRRAEFTLILDTFKTAFDEHVLEHAQSQPKMVINYLNTQMTDSMTAFDIRLDNKLHHGAGGKMAVIDTPDDGNDLTTVDDAPIYFQGMEGARVDIVDQLASPAKHGDSLVIDRVDVANKTIYFESGSDLSSVVADDWIMPEDVTLTQGLAACQFGVPDAIGTTDIDLVDSDADLDFGGLDRAAGNFAGYWKGQAHPYNAQFCFDMIDEAIDLVSDRIDRIPNRAYFNKKLRRAFTRHWHQEYPRVFPNTKDLGAGWVGYSYQMAGKELVLVEDRKIPDGEMWMLWTPCFHIRHTRAPFWRRKGAMLLASTAKPESYAYIHYVWNMTCNNPAANVKVTGITTTN